MRPVDITPCGLNTDVLPQFSRPRINFSLTKSVTRTAKSKMSAILGRTFPSGLQHAGPAGLSLRYFSVTPVASHRISEIIKRDHRELEDAYHNILNGKSTEVKVQWRNQFTWELARHSIGEEMLLYPRIESLFSHGDFLADRDREEHLTVRPLRPMTP